MLPVAAALFALLMTNAPVARESVVPIAEIPTSVAADLLSSPPADTLGAQQPAE